MELGGLIPPVDMYSMVELLSACRSAVGRVRGRSVELDLVVAALDVDVSVTGDLRVDICTRQLQSQLVTLKIYKGDKNLRPSERTGG